MAWTFISTASDICQNLGYHSLRLGGNKDGSLQAAEESLFWAVYTFDKALSLRLGRSSRIRDVDITLPCNPNEPRALKVARIQGKVYDQLYSPLGLSQPDIERTFVAGVLAGELRELIHETRIESLVCVHPPNPHHDLLTEAYWALLERPVIMKQIQCEHCTYNST
jgi:hypothetical protein